MMGTYTANYQLYMPSIGETGWGTLINGNYQTIDTTMKGLSNRITAVENEVNGALSCTSVTASGKITGNGGIAGTTGTFSGNVQAATFNGAPLYGHTLKFFSSRQLAVIESVTAHSGGGKICSFSQMSLDANINYKLYLNYVEFNIYNKVKISAIDDTVCTALVTFYQNAAGTITLSGDLSKSITVKANSTFELTLTNAEWKKLMLGNVNIKSSVAFSTFSLNIYVVSSSYRYGYIV